jgi:hypothetical protein
MFKHLRYVSVSRTRLCQGFVIPALRSFLMEDDNLRRFSFVLNNQSRPVLEESDDEEMEEKDKKKKKTVSRLSNTIEKEMNQSGLKTDLDLLYIIDAAIMHPKLEVLQIVQPLQDYMMAREYVTYYNSKGMSTSRSRHQIENLEY